MTGAAFLSRFVRQDGAFDLTMTWQAVEKLSQVSFERAWLLAAPQVLDNE
jgi:hypothetical protein